MLMIRFRTRSSSSLGLHMDVHAHDVMDFLHSFLDPVADPMPLENADMRIYLNNDIHQDPVAMDSRLHILDPFHAGGASNRSPQIGQAAFVEAIGKFVGRLFKYPPGCPAY